MANKVGWFARPPKFKNRMIVMILGVIAQGFGLSLLMQVDLGTDPCSCLTQGVINYIPITFGTAQLLCHLVTFMFVLVFDRSKIGFGTIGNMVFLGYIADFFTWIWEKIIPEGFFKQGYMDWIFLLPVLLVFICGAAAYMTADLGMSPYDGLPFIISGALPKVPFKVVRIIWDTSFMVAGFLLGGAVGVVTVFVAFFLGPVISWFQKKLAVFIS